MAENRFPKNLLIYSHIDKYCVDVILKNRFVVTDPTRGFNDPLDCYFEFEFPAWGKEGLVEQLMGIFISTKGKALSNLTQEDHNEIHGEKKRLLSLPESILKKELSEYSTDIVRRKLSSFLRIRCFSALDVEKTLNNVMFSHYGDSHKGLCYIFHAENLVPINSRKSLTEVRYSSKPASIEYKADSYSQEELNRIGHDMISIKYLDWRYEREWRLLCDAEFPHKIRETMQFPPNALEGIILGQRATREDEERIIKLVQERSAKVDIFRARRVFESFDLQYEDNPILI